MSPYAHVETLHLDGVMTMTPQVFSDSRGSFVETFSLIGFVEVIGRPVTFVQDNESESIDGTLRGIHYQLGPTAQGKLVRAISGRAFDVAVDLRRGGSTFGQWVGVELDATRGNQIWIPEGFGHAFLALTDGCRIGYKVTAPYDPSMARIVRWNDEDLDIEWPLDGRTPILSDGDAMAPALRTADLFD